MGRCMASEPCGPTTFASEPASSLFIISNSCMWPIWTTDQKEENMDTVKLRTVIGIDVSRDWLDIHCLPRGQRQRLRNTGDGHAQLVDLSALHEALVGLRRLVAKNGACGLLSMRQQSRRGNCRQRKSKPLQRAGARGPRRVGSTQNSLHGSWRSDQIQGDPFHIGSRGIFETTPHRKAFPVGRQVQGKTCVRSVAVWGRPNRKAKRHQPSEQSISV